MPIMPIMPTIEEDTSITIPGKMRLCNKTRSVKFHVQEGHPVFLFFPRLPFLIPRPPHSSLSEQQ
jgi:hypothetical protein